MNNQQEDNWDGYSYVLLKSGKTEKIFLSELQEFLAKSKDQIVQMSLSPIETFDTEDDVYDWYLFKDGRTEKVHLFDQEEFIQNHEQDLEPLVLIDVLGNMSAYIELTDGSKHRVQVKNLTEFCNKYRDRIVEKQFDMQPCREVLV